MNEFIKVKKAELVLAVTSVHTAQFLHCTHHFLSLDREELVEVGLSEANAEINGLMRGSVASDSAVGQ